RRRRCRLQATGRPRDHRRRSGGPRAMMRRTARASSRGMTIVELLVAMVIGLFMVGATYSMYLAYQRAYTVTDQVSRMAESGRFALHLVSSDIRLAGFFGEASAYNIDRGRDLGAVAG